MKLVDRTTDKSYSRWVAECTFSLTESRERRERVAALRTRRRIWAALSAPYAVVGVILLVHWITLPFPVEQWWVALAAGLCIMPFIYITAPMQR